MASLRRYRIPLAALAVSAAVHAAMMLGLPKRIDAVDERVDAIYSATLEAAATPAVLAPPPPAAVPRPPRAVRKVAARAPRSVRHVAALDPLEPLAPLPAPDAVAIPGLETPDFAQLERLALAAPTAEAAREPEPAPFSADAIPADLSIDYKLTSAFAEGRANYRWSRDGDRYRITGEAEAEGFFALFLEGQILQEARGAITAAGLQPEAFSERKPNAPAEGLEFDWAKRTVVQDRNGNRKTVALQDNTVDWLSMIFQLAARPPEGEAIDMKVYTQRKLYAFRLQVLGTEEIDIPLGHVRALHLKHIDPEDKSEVDVWLGVDQYYVPVKMRYPVAKNRLTVEQVATRIAAR